MNRTGPPPQQRAPNLAPAPGLGGPFRGPYPQYGMQPRNVIQGYPGMPQHRSQTMMPQPTPGFMQQQQQQQQQRQGTFPFGSGLQQPQQSPAQQALHQQHQQATQAQQQQQAAGQPTPSLPPHLAQNAPPSLGSSALSASSTGELNLDPNDFPALGASPASGAGATNGAQSVAASYASQAGIGHGTGGGGGANVANGAGGQGRDFTADDFPALGGPAAQGQQGGAGTDGHHSSMNGFDGALNAVGGGIGGQSQTPGLLNLSQAQRNVQAGMLSDAEKQRQNLSMKLNHPAWASPNANPGAQPGAYQSNALGQNGTQHPPSGTASAALNAPPGVPPPSQLAQLPPHLQGQQSQAQMTPGAAAAGFTIGNGGLGENTTSLQPTPLTQTAHPQTPAQQVLISAADRWGLLGLIQAMKSADPEATLLSMGTDLGTMGLDMTNQGSLYSTFITPWSDSSAAHSVEPDYSMPPVYNVQPPAPGPSKVHAFNEETLFYMFYSSPRDALQEIAAQELYNRSWRYHKEWRVWLTKDGSQKYQPVPGGEQGVWVYWSEDAWQRDRKEATVYYAELEDKATPAFAPGITLAQAQQATQQQHSQLGSAVQAPQQPGAQRGFGAMGAM